MKGKSAITRSLFAAATLLCLLIAVNHLRYAAPTAAETAETVARLPDRQEAEAAPVETEEEAASTETPPTSDAETPAQSEDQAEEQPDAYLTEYLKGDVEGEQLILVCARGTDAVLTRWEKRDGAWQTVGEEIPAKVGRNGVSENKVEGDGKTPAGLFPLGTAFGIESKPETEMPYRQVTEDSYWVDDAASQFYNRWVEGTEEKDWSSAEHLADYPSAYALAVAIGYNSDPVAAGRGSAIFLHCGGEKATSGCVSVSHAAMREILAWLDPKESPSVLIAQAK